jgi:outer membrane protein
MSQPVSDPLTLSPLPGGEGKSVRTCLLGTPGGLYPKLIIQVRNCNTSAGKLLKARGFNFSPAATRSCKPGTGNGQNSHFELPYRAVSVGAALPAYDGWHHLRQKKMGYYTFIYTSDACRCSPDKSNNKVMKQGDPMNGKKITCGMLLVGALLTPFSLSAQEPEQQPTSTNGSEIKVEDTNNTRTYAEQDWGIAMGMRYAEIPYGTSNGDRTVADIVPLMYFDNDYFYIRGLEGGIKLINNEQWKLNAITRYRFFDIPADYQNEVRGDAWDGGAQVRYNLGDWDLRTELMSDGDGKVYADIGFDTELGDKYATLYPYIGLRLKSSGFNTKYYGFDLEEVSGGADIRAQIGGRYHLVSNLYLLGRLGGTILDSNARDSSYVDKSMTWEAYAGIAFFNNPDKPRRSSLRNNAYLRVAHGEATESNFGEILQGDVKEDIYHNKLTSLFYGHPLTDDLFGLPLNIYLVSGLVYHHNSEVQQNFNEYALGIKADYTFKWPVRWRIGMTEGLSYASDITYIERVDLEGKGYRPSKLLNYLDFTIDINIGDIFNARSLKNTYLGYSVHHRSGIFGTGSQFGRISGGSNYTTFYLQQHF